jgi:rare lipoprotein A
MNKEKKNHFMIIVMIMIAFVVLSFSSCIRKRTHLSPKIITGQASWYGPEFHGRATASHEVFDMYDMTAAHRTLPFGTYVMVTNCNNGKSVKVRINDRGPFIKGRVIDLSYAAAKVLGMVGPGVIPVHIEILSYDLADMDSKKFAVQVGAFVNKKNAEALKSDLDKKYKNVYISLFKTPHRIYYRVRLYFNSREAALETSRLLQKQGFNVFICGI